MPHCRGFEPCQSTFCVLDCNIPTLTSLTTQLRMIIRIRITNLGAQFSYWDPLRKNLQHLQRRGLSSPNWTKAHPALYMRCPNHTFRHSAFLQYLLTFCTSFCSRIYRRACSGQFQVTVFSRFCYVLLCNHEYIHCLNHRQAKDYITRRNETEIKL